MTNEENERAFELFCDSQGRDHRGEYSGNLDFWRALWNEAKRQTFEEAARATCEWCAKNHKPLKWDNGIWYHSDVAFVQTRRDEPVLGGQPCLAHNIRTLKDSLQTETISS
jgi:hypothetical protein